MQGYFHEVTPSVLGPKRLKLISPMVAIPSLFLPHSPLQPVASLVFLRGTKPLLTQGLHWPLRLVPVYQIPTWLPPAPSLVFFQMLPLLKPPRLNCLTLVRLSHPLPCFVSLLSTYHHQIYYMFGSFIWFINLSLLL